MCIAWRRLRCGCEFNLWLDARLPLKRLAKHLENVHPALSQEETAQLLKTAATFRVPAQEADGGCSEEGQAATSQEEHWRSI